MGATATLRVLLRMEVEPGREEEFENVWFDHATAIGARPENLGQCLLTSASEGSTYYVITDWVDEPSFREFERSESQQEYLKQVVPMRVRGSMTLLMPRYQLGGSDG